MIQIRLPSKMWNTWESRSVYPAYTANTNMLDFSTSQMAAIHCFVI